MLHKISLQSNSSIDEETLASFRESIHGDMQNLHLEILRQFHVQEVSMFLVLLYLNVQLVFQVWR